MRPSSLAPADTARAIVPSLMTVSGQALMAAHTSFRLLPAPWRPVPTGTSAVSGTEGGI